MSKKLTIVMAQLNLCVGDISGNLEKHIIAANRARDEFNADIIVFPELSITGYPPEDLLLRPAFIQESELAVKQFIKEIKNIYCLIGHPHYSEKHLYNACSFICNGNTLGRYYKKCLPNYGVFDEKRYFTAGTTEYIVNVNNIPIGIIICEDIWNSTPIQHITDKGARIILVPNASPFEIDKHEQRHTMLAKRAKGSNVPIVYVNCVGQQDDLTFDGGSMAVDQKGKIAVLGSFCEEELIPVKIEVNSLDSLVETQSVSVPSEEKRIYDCLVMGVRDYLQKNQFNGALVGVSGGIDSALTLAIAVDALGKENVKGILLPSRYTSKRSMEDALLLIKNLGVEHEIISIEPSFSQFIESLGDSFKHEPPDVTLQNIQSRCRCIILMAISNKTGKILLATGNRSEMAVGYATLYGDMSGGLAVLKDITKTEVYQLSRYRNQISSVIPESIFERAPTAELAPGQKDEDTLPPYDVLDKILELYINQSLSVEDIINQGFDKEVVTKVVKMINHSEYKRRQAAIGIRINHTAFGRDRRYPITSKFKN